MSASAVPDPLLASSRLDSEILAESRTFVVFSLATDILHNVNPNIHVKEVLKNFKPKKYLGLILSEVSVVVPGVGEIQNLRLVGVGSRPPQADYARRARVPQVPWLYSRDFLCLDACSHLRESDRPLITPVPSLPWKDCLLHTTVVTRCEVGSLQPCPDLYEVSPRDIQVVENIVYKDNERSMLLLEACQEGRVFLEQETGPAATDSYPLIYETTSGYPKEIEEEASKRSRRHLSGFGLSLEQDLFRRFGPRPDWRVIVNISEDLSELSHVPYPGDFQEECDQVSRLMDLAWERLPYDNVLMKWPKKEDQTDNWDNFCQESYPVIVTSPSDSTSSQSSSPISTRSCRPEALLPLPESPRFEELPDDLILDQGVTVSSDAPEIPVSFSSQHPESSSVSPQSDGMATGLDDSASEREVAVQDTGMGSSGGTPGETSTAPTSSESMTFAPLSESSQTEKASHAAPATRQLVVDMKSEASSREELPEKSRRRYHRLRTARREATRKACSCFLETSRGARIRITTLVRAAGRTGKRVLQEIVRCIIEPL